MSIQPVNKAAEHLINSTSVLENKTKKTPVNAYLIKNSKGGGGGRGTVTSSRKDWAEYYVTVHPYNYFKVCTWFTLERVE